MEVSQRLNRKPHTVADELIDSAPGRDPLPARVRSELDSAIQGWQDANCSA